MKEGWRKKYLVKEFRLRSGDYLSSKMMEEGSIPVYGGNGITGFHNQSNIEGRHIIIGRVGALCGNVHMTTDRAWVSDNAFVVDDINDNWDIFYLAYILKYLNLNQYASQTAQPVISNKSLKDVVVSLPPLPEQHRIVEHLDSSFAKIDALKANAEKMVEEAKALFASALKEAMTPKEGWEEKTLPEISENLDGRRRPVTKGKRSAGIYPYYGASGIVDYVASYIYDEDILLISEDGANLIARSTPIAFSVTGKVWVNNHAHVVRFETMTTQRFVEYYFSSIKIDEYVTGAAQPKLTQKNLNIIPIPLPPIHDQQCIVAHLDDLSAKVRQLEANYKKVSAECDALKQSILRETFE